MAQFRWVLSRLPNKPQPVAPIYQPEVAARAVVHAAEHPGRREWWVGASTAATLLGDKLVPGVLDRYLARTAYDGQQTDEPVDEDRPSNLWRPVADGGTHGDFDDTAHPRSAQAWASRNRRVVAAATVAAGATWRLWAAQGARLR